MVLRALYCFTAGFMVKEQGSPLDGLISCGAYQVDRLMVGGKWLIELTRFRSNEQSAYGETSITCQKDSKPNLCVIPKHPKSAMQTYLI
jgi:hypothetical protein